jgi:hypothetical protein
MTMQVSCEPNLVFESRLIHADAAMHLLGAALYSGADELALDVALVAYSAIEAVHHARDQIATYDSSMALWDFRDRAHLILSERLHDGNLLRTTATHEVPEAASSLALLAVLWKVVDLLDGVGATNAS